MFYCHTLIYSYDYDYGFALHYCFISVVCVRCEWGGWLCVLGGGVEADDEDASPPDDALFLFIFTSPIR